MIRVPFPKDVTQEVVSFSRTLSRSDRWITQKVEIVPMRTPEERIHRFMPAFCCGVIAGLLLALWTGVL